MNELNISDSKTNWEQTLAELSRLARKFPSRKLYEQIAECYHHMGEHQEAGVILDLARGFPHRTSMMEKAG